LYTKQQIGYFTYKSPELKLAGYFQTVDPYRLFVNDLSLLMKIQVLVSQSKDGTWWYDIDTGTPRLRPGQIQVKVTPRQKPWEGFIGLDLLGNNWTPRGVNIFGGLRKGNNAGRFILGTMQDAEFYYGVGYTRYFEL